MGFNFWEQENKDNEITQLLPRVEVDIARPYVQQQAHREEEPEEAPDEYEPLGEPLPALIYEQLIVEFQQRAKERAKW